MSREEAERLVGVGAVYVAGRRCRDAGTRLAVGQVVTAVLEEGAEPARGGAGPGVALRILHEDAELLAVDKPAGMTAQPTEGRVGTAWWTWWASTEATGGAGAPAGPGDVRGDGVWKDAPGDNGTGRGVPRGPGAQALRGGGGAGGAAAGTIDLPLSKDPSRPGRWRATRVANGIPAFTEYRVLHAGADFCLVELLPQTGRTHQLRAHLTALGAPILGDKRYGGAARAGGFRLHAACYTRRRWSWGTRARASR